MKVGFAAVTHPDYGGGTVDGIINGAVENLVRRSLEAVRPEPASFNTDEHAMAAGKFLARSDADCIVLLFATWAECPVIMSFIREIEHMPLLIWGFPMYKTPGGGMASTGSYVTYAMFKGVLDRAGYAYKGILADTDDPSALDGVRNFAAAAGAYQRLKRSRIGLVGYTSMGIYTGTFDHVLMRVRIGPEVHHIDTYSFLNIASAVPDGDALETAELYRAAADIDPDIPDGDIMKVSGMYGAIQKLKRDMRLDAVNIKCQYELSKEYGMVACVPLSLAADNGIVSSCEGDVLNTVSMLTLSLLTDGGAVTYGDSIHHEDNVLTLSSCGFSPYGMSGPGKPKIRKFMPNRGFAGLLSSFTLKPGRVTVMRLIEDVGDYHMLFFTGEALESEPREGYFPAVRVRLDGNIDGLTANYAGQHFALCYGDQSEKITDLARILKIKAVRV